MLVFSVRAYDGLVVWIIKCGANSISQIARRVSSSSLQLTKEWQQCPVHLCMSCAREWR